jgi:hypothetical protein
VAGSVNVRAGAASARAAVRQAMRIFMDLVPELVA